ncbi:MAG: IS21 family transposase, partial [Acidaminococcaceae bacterium]|nr:IS21 family transposase [Acidaminococcaceae bacterium]
SRYEIFRNEELPLLAKLPATPYELAEWKSATVQFNYHISVNGMLYSVPYEFIKRKVDVRITEKVVEIFYNHNRIASHGRLYGRKGQYSTVTEHMPPDHQIFLEWNGDRFRKWAERIGNNTYNVVNAILSSQRVEQQSYRSCMGILKLAEKHSAQRLEAACKIALSYTATPSYKSIKNILIAGKERIDQELKASENAVTHNKHAITRGAAYYRR